MKSSRYNFFYPYQDDSEKLVAYNSRSSTMALIEKDKYEKFMDFCKDGTPLDDEELVQNLRRGMYIIEDETDELEIIRYNMLQGRFLRNSLGLTIAPTSDCNFRCIYCYEKDVIKPDYMDISTQDKIIEMIKAQAKTIESLNVTWYGGEPLMAFDVIDRLSKEFISVCDEEKIYYSAGIITNGYLLTSNVLEKFKEYRINHAQITIDGTAEIHDKRRPLTDGTGTFESIMNNLKTHKDILPNISLRINVDRSNLDAAELIYSFLKANGLDQKVFPYLGKTSNDNNCYNSPDCLSTSEYSNEYFSNCQRIEGSISLMNAYPSQKSSACGADRVNTFVIGADGELYKCWSDIGNPERSIGNINNNSGIINRTYLDYILFDPTTSGMCKNCNVLPICMGGCPFRRMANSKDNCSIYKYVLEGFLSSIAVQLKRNKESRANDEVEDKAVS